MKKILFALLALMLVLSACTTATPEPTTEAVTEPATVATEETTPAEPAAEPGVEPTAEPAPAEPAAPPAATGPKTLFLGVGSEKYPMRGWQLETDDAFAMNYFGILETLVKVDFDGQIAPFLAESWEHVDDTTWQFNLRQGVTFQNGEPFNADAVVNALTYIKNSPTPPRGITAETFVSLEAVDDYTVVITTADFDALLPNRLTSPTTGILAPQAYIAASGPIDPFGTSTGPFILTKSVPEESLTVVKNPNYWGGPVNLDEVTVLLILDPQVRAGMLSTGEIDIDITIPNEQMPYLEANPELTIFRMQQPRTTTLYFNMVKPPFDNLLVRQAITHAIDKEGIVFATLEGVGTPAVGGFAPFEAWTNHDLTSYPYDPEKARQLLAEAGIEEGELTISVWAYPSRANLPPTAVAIQDMLGKVGINVEVRVAQYDPLEADVWQGRHDMMLLSRGHVFDSYDPEAWFASDYSCTGSYNMSFFCDEEFDALLALARETSDLDTRYDIYRQLQQMLDDEAVGVFLNYTDATFGIRNTVLNFKAHPSERFILTPELDVAQ
jgi:peptide/nickel transport system substrate-binding protein